MTRVWPVGRPVGVYLHVRVAWLHISAADAAEGHRLGDRRFRYHLDVPAAVGTLPYPGHGAHLTVAHVTAKAFVALVHWWDQFLLSGDSSEREDGLVAGVRSCTASLPKKRMLRAL